MKLTPLFAAMLGLIYVYLAIRVVRVRRSVRVALGAGGNADLERAIRVHGNFAEYVPFTLLLLLMMELRNTPSPIVTVIGIAFILGRCAHAWGMSQEPEDLRFRVTGMVATFTTIIIASLSLIWSYVA